MVEGEVESMEGDYTGAVSGSRVGVDFDNGALGS